MTEQTQATAERIRNLIFDAIQDSPYGDESIVAAPLGVTIAAEIDALTADNAQANQWLVNGVAKIAGLEAQLAEARAMLATIRPAWFNDDVRPETLVETCQRQAAEIDALTAERDAARRIERMAVDGRGRENVARITHEVWSMWMRELCKVVSLPEDVLCRLQTPYHNLPADDQASCLAIADDYIRAIGVPLVKIANDTRKERDEAHLLIGKQSDELIRFTNLANDYATASQKLAEARAEVERLRPAAEAWEWTNNPIDKGGGEA